MRRSMRWLVGIVVFATLGTFAATQPPAVAAGGNGWVFAAYGDSPYGTKTTDTAQFEATPGFIDAVNADPDVSLVTHVGDIHSGKQYCTESYDRSIASLWTRFADPLVYTPGDNEWSDCHKTAEGGHVRDAAGQPVDYADGDPLDNLNLVRSIFFAEPDWALGGGKLRLQSQGRAFDRSHPEDAAFVENAMWQRKGVLFVTVDIPGGSNNDTDPWFGEPMTERQQREVRERTGADLRWLNAAFSRAREDDARAVVVVAQADMWDNEKGAAHLTEYEPFVRSLAEHTTAYGKPVLMLNGDSHLYRSDNPLSASAPCVTEAGTGETPCPSTWSNHRGYDVPNFHRIVVHGSTPPMEWLKIRVTAATAGNSFGPFAWTRQQT